MNTVDYYVSTDIEKSARKSCLVGDILQAIVYYAGELTLEDIDSCLEQVKHELEAIKCVVKDDGAHKDIQYEYPYPYRDSALEKTK